MGLSVAAFANKKPPNAGPIMEAICQEELLMVDAVVRCSRFTRLCKKEKAVGA